MNKVLVIGLDGATWDLLKPLAEEGFLPNLASLIESGTYGNLESTIPPITAPAWASFATGKNPGKTGIFNFLRVRNSLDDLAPVTTKDIAGKTFYEIVEDNDRKIVIVNLPLSYPPRTGSPTITSIMTQGKQFIFPASLKDKIPELQEYRLVPNFGAKLLRRDEEYCEDIRQLERIRFKSAKQLFKAEWDFFFILFSAVDWVQHELFNELMSKRIEKNHAAFQVFLDIDNYLGWFIEHLPDRTSILLMSDHGFKVYKGTFYMNRWLMENGFLQSRCVYRAPTVPYEHRFVEGLEKAKSRLVEDIAKARSKGKKPIELPGFVLVFLQKLGLNTICRIIGVPVPIRRQKKLIIDFLKTQVIYMEGIYLNHSGKFQNGIVQPEDARRLKDKIITDLKELRDPFNGEKVFNGVLESEKIYWGERAKFAPDIVILPGDFGIDPALNSGDSAKIFQLATFGGHSMSGIFLAHGSGIKRGFKIEGAKIYDVAPTILHMLGLPVPQDMDGRVLKEIYEEGSQFARSDIEYEQIQAGDVKEQIKARVKELKSFGKI